MPRIVLARVDLPEPDSPTRPSVSPSYSSRSTSTRAGTSWPLLVERLGDVRQLDRCGRPRTVSAPTMGGGSVSSPEPVAVVAAASSGRRRPGRSAARRSGTARRRAGSGRRTRTSAGRCRSGAGCRGSSTARARSCGPRGAAASGAGRPCTDAAGSSKTAAASPSSTILPAYITPTRSHIERMMPRLWAISRTAALLSACSDPDEIEHLGLDRGVEPGGRLVEDEQLRVASQRHRDDDALLHPAGQLVRVALRDRFGIGDADPCATPPARSPRACWPLWPRTREASASWGPILGDGLIAAPDPGRPSRPGGSGTGATRSSLILVMSSPATRIWPPVMTPLRGR